MVNLVGKIMDYEAGEMSGNKTVEFFSEMVKDGIVYQLQGCYQRALRGLIQAGYLAANGDVLMLPDEAE